MIAAFNWTAMALSSMWFILLFVWSYWARSRGISTEWTRKGVHMGGGTATLFFPWVFESLWEPSLLCLAFASILILSRCLGAMPAIHAIGRPSYGAYLFPPAVLGTLAYGQALQNPLYSTLGLAVLSYADAGAALVGKSLGKWRYAIHEGRKSMEGSLTFWVVSSVILALGLGLFTPLSPLLWISAALYAGLLLSAMEMMAWRGLDNLILPLATVYILERICSKTPLVALLDLTLILFCLAFAITWLRTTRLPWATRAALGTLVYGALRLMDWPWALPIFLALFAFRFAHMGQSRPGKLQVAPIFWGVLPLILWIFVANQHYGYWDFWYFLPYLMCCTGLWTLALHREAQVRQFKQKWRHGVAVLGPIGVLCPSALYYTHNPYSLLYIGLAIFASSSIALYLEIQWEKARMQQGLEKAKHWLPRAGLLLGALSLGAAWIHAGVGI